MKICTIVVTRSKSCAVKTLHTILKLNIFCLQKNVQNEILYVNDDPFDKVDMIQKALTKCDRIFFVDLVSAWMKNLLNKFLKITKASVL